MNKLKTIIQYECTTSFKYIWYFYAIQYAVIALTFLIVAISTGSLDKLGSNGLELNTMVYVAVLGALGFKEDFKMLIQNGFTRKYIFFGTIAMFAFISGTMALVDIIIGNVLNSLFQNYFSLIGSIYGYNYIFLNWICLFLFYLIICCLFYLGVLTVNRLGKTVSIILGIILGSSVLLIIALIQYTVPDRVVSDFVELASRAAGFMGDGSINFIFPVLTLLLSTAVLGIGSYAVIRRTELR